MSNDAYCGRCDVLDHIEGSPECVKYFTEVETPFQELRRSQVGKIMAASDTGPDLYDRDNNMMDISPGTLLRLTKWTPWQPGARAGNYWSVETLDGEFTGTQVHDYELTQSGVLDKLWLASEESDGPRS